MCPQKTHAMERIEKPSGLLTFVVRARSPVLQAKAAIRGFAKLDGIIATRFLVAEMIGVSTKGFPECMMELGLCA